jgi:serine phosphatase RsbU (regulator of sigma subunit)
MFKRNEIPERYVQEFRQARTAFIRSRVQTFLLLTFGAYALVTFLGLFVLFPGDFKSAEGYVWIPFTAGVIFLLYINRKVRTPVQASASAYLAAVFVAAVLTKICMIYVEYASVSSPLYVFMLFLAAIILPLSAADMALVGLIYAAAYGAYYLFVTRVYSGAAPAPFRVSDFTDGLTYLGIATFLSMIIRHKELARETENFILLKEVEEKNEAMEKELALAREIHTTLIPKSMSTSDVDVAVNYVPVSTVGGDYASFHVTREGNLFFLISDITGHGVPAALIVNRVYGEIEALKRQDPTPGTLLKELDKFVEEHFAGMNMYLSTCCGLVDFKKKQLVYSNYGHPPQILLQRKDKKICLLESQTSLLGTDMASSDSGIFEGGMNFERGDRIILFTDGLIETMDGNKEMFGMERLEEFAMGHSGEHPAAFNHSLL